MENQEKNQQNALPASEGDNSARAADSNAATDNRNSVVGGEGSRYDVSSTQDSYQDPDRLDNQISSPERGEFGAHGHLGHTHGGYGNQARHLAPEPARAAAPPSDTTHRPNGYQMPEGNGDNGLGMGGTHSQQNDNGSVPGHSQGFSDDYGNTSGGSPVAGHPGSDGTGRNQSEDDHSSRGGYDNQGHSDDSNYQQPNQGAPAVGQPAQLSHQPSAPDGSPAGPGSYSGSTSEGHGSRGGSYNDEYDASDNNSAAGSPARGDYDSQDQSRNYGPDSQRENRPANNDASDYGAAPRRNSGRDDE